MKFRGKMTDVVSIRQFAQVIQTLSKSCKQLILRVTEERLILVFKDAGAGNRDMSAWCEVPRQNYFAEYTMEGVSPENNEIYMDIPSESVASTLSGLKSAQNFTLKIKLTKKNVPCLTFEIETQATNSNAVCVHDIPVSMITRRHWDEYQEPDIPTFDVSLGMPDLKIVRQTLERLKNLGPKLSISANKSGKLYFSAETNAVRSSVTYSDLRLYDTGPDIDAAGKSMTAISNDEGNFSIDVDMKSMLQLVPSEQLRPTKFIFSFVEGRLAHFFYLYGDITLQYCLPGVM